MKKNPYWARYVPSWQTETFKRPKSDRRSCWNCARLRKSHRNEDVKYREDGSIECYSMGCDSYIDAISRYQCDHYWFGDKPDDDYMLCGGREWRKK